MKNVKFTFLVVLILSSILTGTVSAQDDDSYVIGLIGFFDFTSITDELRILGYIEGENITYRLPLIEGWEQWEEMTQEELMASGEAMNTEEAMAAYMAAYEELASAPDVDVFLTNTDSDAVALLPLLSNPNTPVVFARSDDPVATGAVEDLIAPGSNVTGIITNRPHERRLQILTEIKPETDVVYYLYSVMTGEAETVLQQVQAVAEELDIEVVPGPITDIPSAIALFETVPEGVDWLFLTPHVPFDFGFYGAMNAASLQYQAGITGVTALPIVGYVMGYGPDIDSSDRQAARTVDRILRGARPADLPVQIAENALMVNLEAAAVIDLEIPVGILRQADLIIRPGDFDQFGMYIGNN